MRHTEMALDGIDDVHIPTVPFHRAERAHTVLIAAAVTLAGVMLFLYNWWVLVCVARRVTRVAITG